MPATSKTMAAAAALIAEKHQAVALNTAQRLQLLDPYRAKHPELPDLLGRLPRMLTIVSTTFREGFIPERFTPAGTFHAVIVEHARLRHEQGLTAGPVAWEYHTLRQEIWSVLQHELLRRFPAAPAADVFQLSAVLDQILDQFIGSTVTFFGTIVAR